MVAAVGFELMPKILVPSYEFVLTTVVEEVSLVTAAVE